MGLVRKVDSFSTGNKPGVMGEVVFKKRSYAAKCVAHV